MQRSMRPPASDNNSDEDWSSVVNRIIDDLDANLCESETEADESDAGFVDPPIDKPVADAPPPPTDAKPVQLHLTRQMANGYPKLCIDGYMFHFIYQYTDQRVLWTCSRTKPKCPATAITSSIFAGNVPRLDTPPVKHNHANGVGKARRKTGKNGVRRPSSSASNVVSLFETKREGQHVLCVDGYLYHCKLKTNMQTTWDCIERRRASKCLAQAFTTTVPLTGGDVPRLLGFTNEHSHAPPGASDVDPPMIEMKPASAEADVQPIISENGDAYSESMELDEADATPEDTSLFASRNDDDMEPTTTDPKSVQFQLARTKPGGFKLHIDGYVFYSTNKYSDEQVHWHCSRNNRKCPASAITSSISAGHVLRLLTPPCMHNHVSNVNAVAKNDDRRPSSSASVVRLEDGERGGQVLCVDGHTYHCCNRLKHQTTWTCIERHRKCTARAITQPLTGRGVPKLIGFTGKHSHAPGAAASQIKAARSCSTAGKQFKTTKYISQVPARIVAVRSPHPDVDPPMNESQPNADADAVACSESMELNDVDATAETGQSRRTSNKHEFGAKDTLFPSRIDDLNANSAELATEGLGSSSDAHAKYIGKPTANEPTIDSEPAQLQLAKTKNGGTKLCIDGFTFYSSNQNSDKQVYWVCSRHTQKCPAKVYTSSITAGHVPRLLSPPAEHNHVPYVDTSDTSVLRQASSSSVVSLETGGRGGQILCVDGHSYYCQKENNHYTSWVCIEQQRAPAKCMARVTTEPLTGSGVPKLIGFTNEHSHAPAAPALLTKIALRPPSLDVDPSMANDEMKPNTDALDDDADTSASNTETPESPVLTTTRATKRAPHPCIKVVIKPPKLSLLKTNEQGHPLLCVDGYTFNRIGVNVNEPKKSYWVCVNRLRGKRGCRSKAITIAEDGGVGLRLHSHGVHSHAPQVEADRSKVVLGTTLCMSSGRQSGIGKK